MTAPSVKRFYKTVEVLSSEQGHAISLDGKTARTPQRHALAAPSHALAEAVAEEWRRQGDTIDRRDMKLTGLLTAALDGADDVRIWVDEVVNYLGTDLLCYLAEAPAALRERQQEVWGPYLGWFEKKYGVALLTASGIVAVAQPPEAPAVVRKALENEPAIALMGVKTATALAGSAVLALALLDGGFDPAAIFDASRLDERFQEGQWGEDAEAKARECLMEADFMKTAEFLRLARA